jgi:molybdenum cofactor biosynthesis enzyme MoaA
MAGVDQVNFPEKLHRLPGIHQVCLTANGVFLEELALDLFGAGLRRLNVILDTRKSAKD